MADGYYKRKVKRIRVGIRIKGASNSRGYSGNNTGGNAIRLVSPANNTNYNNYGLGESEIVMGSVYVIEMMLPVDFGDGQEKVY